MSRTGRPSEFIFKIIYKNKGYDKKTYPKLVLNRLKVMRGLTPIYTPLGI